MFRTKPENMDRRTDTQTGERMDRVISNFEGDGGGGVYKKTNTSIIFKCANTVLLNTHRHCPTSPRRNCGRGQTRQGGGFSAACSARGRASGCPCWWGMGGRNASLHTAWPPHGEGGRALPSSWNLPACLRKTETHKAWLAAVCCDCHLQCNSSSNQCTDTWQ